MAIPRRQCQSSYNLKENWVREDIPPASSSSVQNQKPASEKPGWCKFARALPYLSNGPRNSGLHMSDAPPTTCIPYADIYIYIHVIIWGLLFRGGSYLPFYSIKRWVPTPLGVYKLKVPTPLRHYNLNTVAPNQSPEINRKKPSDYKMAGADPPKKNSYNETAC